MNMYRVEYIDNDGFNRFALMPADGEADALFKARTSPLHLPDAREVLRAVALGEATIMPKVSVQLSIEVGFSGDEGAFEGWTKDELLEQAKQAAATMLVNEAQRGDVSGALVKRMTAYVRPGGGDPHTIVNVS